MYKVVVRAAPAGGGRFKNLAWRKVRVRKSLDEICHSVELELPAGERGNIHKHDKVEVRLYSPYVTPDDNPDGTKRVTTVMVDELTGLTDTEQNSLLAVGRSPARDIIDSSWSHRIINMQSLEYVAGEVAKPFGITVLRMPERSPATGPVYSFSWESESPWQKLIAEADNQGYIFTSNEEGNLYLWKVAANKREEGFALDERSNIRNVQITENGAEQFHVYVVKGGGRLPIREYDSTCKNNREMTINLTDLMVSEETMRRRALTEMKRRKYNRVLVTVSGWGLSESHIKTWSSTFRKEIVWNPNFLIPVNLPSCGLSGKLLIPQVEYQADRESMTSTITLADPEAYA
ncbi:MAG: hypothetical protein LBU19_05920 [Treponema sp.]|jgi:prophage tail gpP-like protein|nr:hypothetical protein [Treponema sp.]